MSLNTYQIKLANIFDSSFKSEFVLIHDNKETKGELLLKELISHSSSLGHEINILHLENLRLLQDFKDKKNVTNHFCLTDSRGWLSNDSGDTAIDNVDPIEILHKAHSTSEPGSKNIVIIDSISSFIMMYPEKCYKTIHNLINQPHKGKQKQQIVGLLHTDVFPGEKKTMIMFEQLASTNIILEKNDKMAQATVRHRKSSGKIIQNVEHYYVNENGLFITKVIEKLKENRNKTEKTEKITSDITFKLELEDEEKQARSKLVLPYLKTAKQTGSGEILYEPDELDDWDEEDPDDDLNI